RAFRLGRDRVRAATARRVLRIVEPERIVSAVPHWRDYLVRQWPEAELPAAVLFPRSDAETALWRRWLREGWEHGTALADDIFAADLDRLNRVFEGLVQWRRANLAGMVSAPSLETERIAVSGHGRLIRIGETLAALGPPARFELRPGEWKPLPEGAVR
ncbi:MAG: type IV secretory system conjugative DNA transfer family protein, partial [Rhodospirillaceae bacterium]|nr:type IV secretory system conjugative DNA transfer family protein [Rhodospirillaceae bacterium]